MRKPKQLETLTRLRSLQILFGLAVLYLFLVFFFEFPLLTTRLSVGNPNPAGGGGGGGGSSFARAVLEKSAPIRPVKDPYPLSSLDFSKLNSSYSQLHKTAKDAWRIGNKLFRELKKPVGETNAESERTQNRNRTEEQCPHSIVLTGHQFDSKGRVMVIPCGLTLGSHITIVARPYPAHPENDPKITILREGDKAIMVSQFMFELQGLKTVDGEDPPRILHFNPRLKGDWSNKPVIEMNTCYRMQWGQALRCEGWKSRADEETVDGLVKCEKWIRDDDARSEESKTSWWLNRLIGRTKKVAIDWPFPFSEDKLFVLTLSAGLEGYHVNVDGRHVTSFPYRTGFVLEDATGLSLTGDIELQSIFAGSLPTSHPSYAPQKQLEMSPEWRAAPLPSDPSTELFIGILSAGNHFAERMAVRKTWMDGIRRERNVVSRFFVALHGRKEVNLELKKEAEFFGDIVIVPFLDSYDLVVLKTVAICEYGVNVVAAKYIMKCDDDTFIRLESVMNEVKKVTSNKSLYVGNVNFYHKPLRDGKWAVTYEEWPEEEYPPYANGPGYVVSSDIAKYIVSEFDKSKLRLFKMEDVSMGMWVEQFNKTQNSVEYVHSTKFCQFGCIDEYYTAHYQSPRQMLCMWDKLRSGRPHCCNMR
ncbi:hypothetical protein LUZ60_005198 [Juncus effusus]|nr:hypothetical protein LUZ60_005198 [Juncus effusus]